MKFKIQEQSWMAVDAYSGGVEARIGTVEGSVDQWSQICICIRIRIKFKSRIRIRIKVKRLMRIRNTDYFSYGTTFQTCR
jgi:hypothetical protein